MRLIKRVLVFLAGKSAAFSYHCSFDAQVRFGDSAITIPIVRGMGLEHLCGSEDSVRQVICHVLRRRLGTFVDVGANIGQTLVKVAACDRDRRYVGFEPQPSCIGYLARLIEINRLGGFRVFPVGLFSSRGIAALSCGADADPGASLVPELRAKQYSVSVPVLLEVGDEIFRSLGEEAISVVKVDVEGAESEVLAGLRETLEKYRPILLLEILPTQHLYRGSTLSAQQAAEMAMRRKARSAEIRSFTQGLGYQSFRIVGEGRLEHNQDFEMEVYDHARVNYLFATESDLPMLADIVVT